MFAAIENEMQTYLFCWWSPGRVGFEHNFDEFSDVAWKYSGNGFEAAVDDAIDQFGKILFWNQISMNEVILMWRL